MDKRQDQDVLVSSLFAPCVLLFNQQLHQRFVGSIIVPGLFPKSEDVSRSITLFAY